MVGPVGESQYINKERYSRPMNLEGGWDGSDTENVLNMQGVTEWARLRSGITTSRRQMEGFRKRRFTFISEYVGKQYSYYGSRDKVPSNLIALLVSVYRRYLASDNPQIKATTRHMEMAAQAYDLQIALNILLDEIDYESVLEDTVLDAIFTCGIMKIGQSWHGNLDIEGSLIPIGEPYAAALDFDDFVIDMSCRKPRDATFIGDRIRVPIPDLIASGRFKGHEHRFVIADDRYYDESGQELVRKIDTGNDYDHERTVDYTEYYEIYRPRHGDIIVFLCDDLGLPTGDPVEHKEWVGPPSYEGSIGPYHLLGFDPVPNNPIPVSPVAQVFDLHDLANVMYRKVSRQGLRQKKVVGVRTGRRDDGENALTANDGDMIPLDDPRNLNEIVMGGYDANNMALFVHMKQLFSYQAGNLDVLAGLAPQADTLGQEQILAGGSSRKLADYQQSVMKFVKGTVRALAWWYWHNPLKTVTGTKTLPNTGVSVPFEHTPEMRMGGLHRFAIDIEPYSLVHRTPQSRLQDIIALYERIYLPLLPVLPQLGVAFDFSLFSERIAELSNLPELRDILRLSPQPMVPAQVEPTTKQSPVTRRTYERVNRPGSTYRGQEEVFMQSLLGSQMQDSNMQAFGRQVS